jgi:hypothetical protein
MPRTVATPSQPYTTPCDNPQQPCPECGGLECLCRPRFFAGQLLTDQDLNLLNHYIVEKNKLHNRYLHGWGVVCGLEVVCGPCSGVVVNPGYALSPCGEDIIVCQQQAVDVCSLINACKKPKNNCNPIDAVSTFDNCVNTTEKWVLAIRYHEKATRGVTSLKGASGCSRGSSCSCGGSSSAGCGGTQTSSSSSGGCGCGCTQSGTTSSSSASTQSKTPAQCEPTAICEGYVFEVCKMANAFQSASQAPVSPLIARLQCCLKLMTSTIPAYPTNPSQQDIQNFCCALRENLADLFAAHPGHACQLTAQLGTLCKQNFDTLAEVLQAALPYLIQFFMDCVCSALLPPCPAPVNDDRIFLATITINCSDCSIVEICNWDQRKFALGFPMLSYWLSPLQIGASIKNLIAKICCAAPKINAKVTGLDRDQALKFQNTQYPATAEQRSAALSGVIAKSYSRSEPVGADTLVLADLGAGTGDAYKQPVLSDAEMQMPMEALLIGQIAGPLLGNIVSVSGLGNISSTGGAYGTTGGDTLRDQVNNMKKTIDEHTKTIAELTARLEKQ